MSCRDDAVVGLGVSLFLGDPTVSLKDRTLQIYIDNSLRCMRRNVFQMNASKLNISLSINRVSSGV